MITDNPVTCGCEAQEAWEWLRAHKRMIGVMGGPRCEAPPSLQTRPLMQLRARHLCALPLVLKLAIQDIQPFSLLVSWQSRNHSALHGYQVAYYAEENLTDVCIIHTYILVMYNICIFF